MNNKPTKRFHIPRISPKANWREILAILMLCFAIIFFRNERKELLTIVPQLAESSPKWLLILLTVSIATIVFQAGIYIYSFSSLGLKFKLAGATDLFLKRNFLSVFLPAGGVSALAYLPRKIRNAGYSKIKVHQASMLYALAGILSLIFVAIPVSVLSVYENRDVGISWVAVPLLMVVIFVGWATIRSFRKQGILYQLFNKRFPSIVTQLHDLAGAQPDKNKYSFALLSSLGVEVGGMLMLYFAILAVGQEPSFKVAAITYVVSILMVVISPFLRGLGAVELSMVLVLHQFGYASSQALSITLLYRIFEFWLPLVAGLLSFAWRGRKIFSRAFPALLAFSLGIVNILSAITPPLHQRMRLLRQYLPLDTIHASNLLVLLLGIALIITSAFLVKGLRNAWIITLVLSFISLIGNITKALDYEEATFAAITIVVLAFTYNQYPIKSSRSWLKAGFKTAIVAIIGVFILSYISFYYINKRHFGIDFTWEQSLYHTFRIFLLVQDDTLLPLTRFGNELLWFLRSLGFIMYGFILFCLIKTESNILHTGVGAREKAKFLLSQFGNSAVDYFKIYPDKLIFLSELHEAFIAYRISGGFAIVLEEPVCDPDNKVEVVQEFDRHCRKMGLKPAFYRVDEDSIPWFNQLGKNKLKIGQEAILEVSQFTLEGKEKKSLRNGLNSLLKKGYLTKINKPPHSENLMTQIKQVSEEWLIGFNKKEQVFSQGIFNLLELKEQDIITIEDSAGKIEAFLNIIPTYNEEVCTYDLIRKSKEAPGAVMDALIVGLINYAKEQGKEYLNLGMVPMSGILHPENAAESIIKLFSERARQFQHYRGLRNFKEKYASFWENKYLVYDNDFDLLQLPVALNSIMKPL